MNTPESLTTFLKQRANELGFALAGACPAVTPPRFHRLVEWIEKGYMGTMHYLSERREAYADPNHVLPGVRSLLVLGMHYRTAAPNRPSTGYGRVSRYAWGAVDYHDLIHERLRQLCGEVQAAAPGISIRGVVDTAPVMEREFAELAGLGWIGKHTLLLTRDAGSWFFLAVLLLDCDLIYDTPTSHDYCGTCTACLDACPTQAFPAPYVLDARRCISYLTIELRDPIPRELRSGVGDWIFGCDICQDVCPWNRRSPQSPETAYAPRDDRNPLDLRSLFSWSDADFRTHFRQTPLWRPKRRGILRNAAIVLGNQRDVAALDELRLGLNDDEPLVRGASAWALGEIGTRAARDMLEDRMNVETEAYVREELTEALGRTATQNQ